MNQYEKKSLLVLAAVIIFMVFFGIGGVPLLDPDEPVYAETAREMILTGDYLSRWLIILMKQKQLQRILLGLLSL